jgi:hypothetical protein
MAGVCALCALRPEAVASYLRRRYLRSGKFVQNWPFSGIVMKSWYPRYLRIMGVGGLFCAIIWCCLVVRTLPN